MQSLSDIKPSIFVSFFGHLMVLLRRYSTRQFCSVVGSLQTRIRVPDRALVPLGRSWEVSVLGRLWSGGQRQGSGLGTLRGVLL